MSFFSDLRNTSVISKKRLEMLYDGIFAIAMTILVLEVKAPEVHGVISNKELIAELIHALPTMGSYGASFIVLGTIWHRHNEAYQHIERISGLMFWMHIFQLLIAAFVPFCAALLGRFPSNNITFVLYIGVAFAFSVLHSISWEVAKIQASLDPKLDMQVYSQLRRRNWKNTVFLAVSLSIVTISYIVLP
jgi:uncharacterized membrane protein